MALLRFTGLGFVLSIYRGVKNAETKNIGDLHTYIYIYIHLNIPLPIEIEVYADLHRLHARKCSKSTSPTAFDSSLKR